METLTQKTRTEQRTTVLVHLLRKGPLTQPEALDLGVWRLAARCCELGKAGWRIQKERLPGNFVRYTIDPNNPYTEDRQSSLPFEGGAE